MITWLQGKKTYIVAALMAVTALMSLLTGEMTLQEFVMSDHITTLMEAMGFGTLRAGIAKRIG